MLIRQDADLSELTTFGVPARAARLLTLDKAGQLEGIGLADFNPTDDRILGGGSNILFVGDFPHTLLLNRLRGRGLLPPGTPPALPAPRALVGTAPRLAVFAAGENWHDCVLWSLEQGYGGLENLSLIPGTMGAAPIQNIGAYGVELSDRLDAVQVWDWQRRRLLWMNREQCELDYRTSRFKHDPQHRYLITAVRLWLSAHPDLVLDYRGVRETLEDMLVETPHARQVSQAVIRLRQRKLPDPAEQGNAGSFFKNPVVDRDRAEALAKDHPDLPVFPVNEQQAKLSAAWLIEQCGLKGERRGGAAVSDRHALVLVNEGAASGADVWQLMRQVQHTVESRFGVALQPEVRLFGQLDSND